MTTCSRGSCERPVKARGLCASHYHVAWIAGNLPAVEPRTAKPKASLVPVRDESWMREGACRSVDPAVFFPERGASVSQAKATCAGCTVRSQCLAYAVERSIRHGVWGGMSERQRRKLRKRDLAAAS